MKYLIYIFLFITITAYSQKVKFEGEIYPKDTCHHVDKKIIRLGNKLVKEGYKSGIEIIETDSLKVFIRHFPYGGKIKCIFCGKVVRIEPGRSDTIPFFKPIWQKNPFKNYIIIE